MPMDFLQASALFTGVVAELPEAHNKVLEEAAELIETEAKRVLGTYDYGWPPLQPATIARKTTGDSPLLETGELRDSIEHYVDKEEHKAYVGSNNPKAKWHEFGTSRIPARSFLMGACMHSFEDIRNICKENYRKLWIHPYG